MKKVIIKDKKVIAVWNIKEDKDYKKHYTDYDKIVEVKDDVEVFTGMSEIKEDVFVTLPNIEEIKRGKIEDLKYKTKNKIYSKYSKEKQSTYQIISLGLIEKVLQGKKLTKKDKVLQKKAGEMKDFILREVGNYSKEKQKIIKE